MGLIAESVVAYAQPLFDATDGSLEQMQKAMGIAQMCWNLALLPESKQEAMLDDMRSAFEMDDAEFAEMRESIIAPMILRHHEMFPNMPRPDSQPTTRPSSRELKSAGIGRNDPCPCNSGKKYKRCCGK